jgi:formate hydrogenlyase transcriptional activator
MGHRKEISATAGEGAQNNCSESFEALLLEISALFINIPIDTIDSVIEDAQRRICEYLGLDLSSLWQWSEKDPRIMTITHLFSRPDGPERPENIDASISFPWVFNRVLGGEMMIFSNRDLPVEAAAVDLASRSLYGVESTFVIPLRVGDEPILGILTFETLGRERFWDDSEVQRLTLVATIFANTLRRRRAQQNLRDSEARLSLAVESAGAGLWEFDCATSLFWANERARAMFNYGTDERISMDRFERSVYVNDLLAVKEALAESFATGRKLKTEYRISAGKHGYKWVCSMGRPYFDEHGAPARMLGISLDISERKRLEERRREDTSEIKRLKKLLEKENTILREELKQQLGTHQIIGSSPPFKAVIDAVNQVAPTTATVLIRGETGTGKGLIAHLIHQLSERKSKPFVTVNCAALPASLIESELFGHAKGAYTGAHASQVGRFEVADGGTIFLDEIGEMSLEMQAKLLRVLQDGNFEKLGSPRTIRVDTRVIAATARDLKGEVAAGRFREDLFYRLNVFPISIPPLRQRISDISLLVEHFMEKFARKTGKHIDRIPSRALEIMCRYHWPGNVRELEHIVQRSVILSPGSVLAVPEQTFAVTESGHREVKKEIKDLRSTERDHIIEVLAMTNWKIEGAGGAAGILDIHPSTLRFRIKKLNIERPG